MTTALGSLLIFEVNYATFGGWFQADCNDVCESLKALGKTELLPECYRTSLLRPLIQFLGTNDGQEKFKRLAKMSSMTFAEAEQNTLASAIGACLQRRALFLYEPTSFRTLLAMQAVVADIYNHAISCLGVKQTKLPPLVKWEHNQKDPEAMYAYLAAEVKEGVPNAQVDIVCLSEKYRMGRVSAWVATSHEVAGHAVLGSNPDLLNALTDSVRVFTSDWGRSKGLEESLVGYWSSEVQMEGKRRAEEVASDILGTLVNPFFGVGLLAYSVETKGKLCFEGLGNHPPIIWRMCVIAGVLKAMGEQQRNNQLAKLKQRALVEGELGFPLLSSSGLLRQELEPLRLGERASVLRSLGPQQCEIWAGWIVDVVKAQGDETALVQFGQVSMSFLQAREYGLELGKHLATTKLTCLKAQLAELMQWGPLDEEVVAEIQACIGKESAVLPTLSRSKELLPLHYTRHVVTAALLAHRRPSSPEIVFENMREFLIGAHGKIVVSDGSSANNSADVPVSDVAHPHKNCCLC